MDAFVVQRAVCAILLVDHISHLEVVTSLVLQSILCKWVVKLMMDGRDLAFRGLNFVPPDSATHILVRPEITIAAASRDLFYLLSV